ncbi:hypothetical protein EVAR_93435_1 [Eumeta japonica]|uniref:Uncharacterized protein n=1 Tax=Eumeta variegata TaxID=151549 RepID=A0A4C1TKB5_EUMVA|nr:hypothetical protein EVAR_93435_1 [Eumeta japonica]
MKEVVRWSIGEDELIERAVNHRNSHSLDEIRQRNLLLHVGSFKLVHFRAAAKLTTTWLYRFKLTKEGPVVCVGHPPKQTRVCMPESTTAALRARVVMASICTCALPGNAQGGSENT